MTPFQAVGEQIHQWPLSQTNRAASNHMFRIKVLSLRHKILNHNFHKFHGPQLQYLVWARLTVSRFGNCIKRFADFEVIWVNGAWKFRRFWNPLNSLNFKCDIQFLYFQIFFPLRMPANLSSFLSWNKNRIHSLFSKISSEDVSKIFNSLGPVSEHRPSHFSKSADISSEK